MMEWINVISNTDSKIHDICIKDSCIIVYIKLWNEIVKQVKFLNYYIFKDKRAIGEEIGDVKVQKNSQLLDELKQDIFNTDGSLDEIAEVKSITFYNAWNDTILLEVVVQDVEFE